MIHSPPEPSTRMEKATLLALAAGAALLTACGSGDTTTPVIRRP